MSLRASQLLGAVKKGSTMAVDALVVAVAVLAGVAVIATVDIDDMPSLAAHAKDVSVISI